MTNIVEVPNEIISDTSELNETVLTEQPSRWNFSRILSLVFSYSSYSMSIFYNVVLFNAIQELLTNTMNGEEENTFTNTMSFILVFSLCSCDIIINLLAIQPPEIAHESHLNDISDLTETYILQHMSNALIQQKRFIKRSLHASRFISYSSFFVGASSSVLALSELNANPGLTWGLGGLTTLLGVGFFHMLFRKDIVHHHVWIISDGLRKFSRVRQSFKKNPAASIEVVFQISLNAIYQGITWSFFTSKLLEKSQLPQGANLALFSYALGSSAYSALFTRLYETKKYYLDNTLPTPLLDIFNTPKKYLTNTNFLNSLLFATLRNTGLSYIIAKNIPSSFWISISSGIFTWCLASMHSTLVAMQRVRLTTENLNDEPQSTHSNRLENTLNTVILSSRLLRILAVVQFLETSSDFLRSNGINFELSLLDAYLLSLAAVGVEASNYFFYKSKTLEGVNYIKQKYHLECRRSQEQNTGFSWANFFFRSITTYEPAQGLSSQVELGNL